VPELFSLRTSRVAVHWSGPAAKGQGDAVGAEGTLRVRPRRARLVLEEGTQRLGIPPEVASELAFEAGPPLFEETSYDVFLRGVDGAKVSLRHRDPLMAGAVVARADPSLLYGSINFRSQIGESRFSVFVDGEPELDFTVEVFPSKMAYREDFHDMLARVQDLATGLALEYLQATYHLGAATGSGESSRLEWLALLRNLLDELEKALRHVAARPTRGLVRRARIVRAEQLRRSDHALRKAVLRDRGRGPRRRLSSGVPVRSQLPERRAHPTLDTPEHRWLALQVTRTRRRLASLLREEVERLRTGRFQPTKADRQAVRELQWIESRLTTLEQLEPLAAATKPPPSGFASLQLQGAPGYREAYRALTILQQGLRIGGGPVEVSLKDLHVLYEYWCFLEVVTLVAEILDHPIPVRSLVEVRSDGLRLQLEQGRSQTVPFTLPGGRALEVAYNPRFDHAEALLPQRPDIALTFRDPSWPTVRLVLDAKYRLEDDAEFVARFGAPGPPADAVNVIHRYRDAILEAEGRGENEGPGGGERPGRPSRTVVEGAALFPLDREAAEGFHQSRFWESLDRLGVGALPFLPGSRGLVEEWIRGVLSRSGWETADRAVGYEIRDHAERWTRAAEQPVLVGVLRGGVEAEHLEWILDTRTYYAPLTPTQKRQMSVQWVAIYSPSRLRGAGSPGAVTHVAPVRGIEVRTREEVSTPWPSGRRGGRGHSRLVVLYRLGQLEELPRVVENRGLHGEGGSRFSTNRWSSRLALDRASEVTELMLESRAEWRFYEQLRAAGTPFELHVDRAPDEKAGREGRVWFVLDDRRVRWAGAKGWEVRKGGKSWYQRGTVLPSKLRPPQR
jgi:uncharacterized protein